MKPTYEELENLVAELRSTVVKLEAHIAKQDARIAELESRLNKNSKNSSKPPSSDPKKNTPQKERKKRSPRRGHARSRFSDEEIDQKVECTADLCPHCGSKDLALMADPVIFQQVELPEVRGQVTEFRQNRYSCGGCRQRVLAPLPEGIPHSVFGSRLMAAIASLTGVYQLSKRDAKQLVADFFGVEISCGSVTNIEERVTNCLRPIYGRIHQFVVETISPKHVDETPWRDSGLSHYAWVLATQDAVCYRIDRRRNQEALSALIGRLNPRSLVVTDRYSVYNKLAQDRQYCIPHLIRNFSAFSQRDGPLANVSAKIEEELRQLSHIQSEYRSGRIGRRHRSQRLRWCHSRLSDQFIDGMCADIGGKFGNLCEKLFWVSERLFAFSKHPGAEPSNNLAERDLRRVVLWRKKSYGTRSQRGRVFVETISTVSQTLRRSKQKIFSFLVDSVERFYGGLEAPLIQPAFNF